VVAKFRERLAGMTRAAQKFDEERFNLRKQNDWEVREEQYQIEIANRFSALENLIDDEDIHRAWDNIKVNIKSSAKDSLGQHQMKQHKP
jgi:hypothetical protein